MELAIEALGSRAVVFQNESVYCEIFNLHTNSDKLSDPTFRNNTIAFIRPLNKAEAVFTNDPSSVWSRTASAVGISQTVLQAVWPIHFFRGTLAADLLDVLVDEDVWVAQQDGRAALTRADLTNLIDSTVLADALKT